MMCVGDREVFFFCEQGLVNQRLTFLNVLSYPVFKLSFERGAQTHLDSTFNSTILLWVTSA